ncbi:hypothetical protein FKG94_08670 [Exilibacterium tricleocarpae]|uniref:Uncharacterized protein n=1 Tax=Exilibacterium tricleocarpae TaxID=2591008 RepID=A0A545TVI4_9GAMM|nr:hypothetical protein [Exilibacterium tricleocarpae]TQV81171.1 hypothetical protein FKG94_08670 [Exilibacterium tricleocarpae]
MKVIKPNKSTAFFLLLMSPLTFSDSIVDQSFSLHPGWNALYLEVDPDDGDPQTENDRAPGKVFAAPEISRVWSHPYASTTAQYIQSPSDKGFNEAGWKLFIPDQPGSNNESFLTNLYAVIPGQVYLVKVTGSSAINITVRGKPGYRPIQWQQQQFNLVGFYVDPDQPVTFADMLGLSSGQTPSIYTLGNNSQWTLVPNGKNTVIESGKGYWVYNDGSTYQTGTLHIPQILQNGLSFQQDNRIAQLSLINRLASTTNMSFSVDDNFPLLYFTGSDDEDVMPRWQDIGQLTPSVDPGKAFRKMVSVDLGRLAAGGNDSVLTIRGGGMRIRLPLSAAPSEGQAGLWVGLAILDEVTNVHSATQQTEPAPAPLHFKLLLHVDDSGSARLLKQVYLMSKVIDLPGNQGVDTEAVLVTSDACLGSFKPLNLTNREGQGHRLSTSAFDFATSSLPLTGNITQGGALTAQLLIEQELPTHPMKHRYHVSHDDKDNYSGEPINDDGNTSPFYDEVWDITRSISMTPDQTLSPSPEAGMGQLTGVYSETIAGIHKDAITVNGRYLLQRISRVARLVEDGCQLP